MTDKNYYRFTHVVGDSRVSVKFSGDTNLTDLVEEFEHFIKACGFHVESGTALDWVGDGTPKSE